ncbi:hypothetical protein [Bacteroides pyogenes]|uniref:hypothetical protein n=1 Tax=Bacteroides pyogenes TaxID=310300 RepID=UPI0011E44E51|nr:hypothetical protein [Bacteroides pyogenes]MCE9107602.1 hypothetical protein [Bacteroides pyogenes]TYK39458.1 hypothetical protein FNJ61_03220 [Bacteroides pyogenes]
MQHNAFDDIHAENYPTHAFDDVRPEKYQHTLSMAIMQGIMRRNAFDDDCRRSLGSRRKVRCKDFAYAQF